MRDGLGIPDKNRPQRPAMSRAASYLHYTDPEKREVLRGWILRGQSAQGAADKSGCTLKEGAAMVERLRELNLLPLAPSGRPLAPSKIEKDALADKRQLALPLDTPTDPA